MISSFFRFVSDWAGGGDPRQPPPFRPQREVDSEETVIEMENLVDKPVDHSSSSDKTKEQALREWKRITNVDVFLEQVPPHSMLT